MPSRYEIDFSQEVAETMASFPGSNDSQKFARAVLTYSFELEKQEAINANSCDGSRDRGLDAYYSDDDFLYLIQFKYHADPFGRSIEFSASGPGHQLVHCWPYVSDLDVASRELGLAGIRRELYLAAETFQDEIVNGEKKVKMIVIDWADGPTDAAKRTGDTWLRSLSAGHPIASFDFENYGSIKDRWEKLKLPASRHQGTVQVAFNSDCGYNLISTPKRGIVVTVRGSEIVELHRRVGDSLLDPNVRFGLPISKFNLRIKETAQQNPDLFWYYNNGITILCDGFNGEDTGTLNITNPGIVNGGQTMRQLREAGAIESGLLLTLRVIESSEKHSAKTSLFTQTLRTRSP